MNPRINYGANRWVTPRRNYEAERAAAREKRVLHLERLAQQAETPGGANHYLSLLVRMHSGKETVSI